MKLSQLSLKEFKIKSIKLLPTIKKIALDEEIKDTLYKKIEIEAGMSELEIKKAKYEYNTNKIFKMVELLLDKHEIELYTVLSIIYDTNIEEVESWTLAKFMDCIADLGEDEGFSRLFTLAVK